MRAARVHDWNADPVVEEVPVPIRAKGQSLVRVEAATISHLDLTVHTGDFALKPALPYVPGCEGAGTVVESDVHAVGSSVSFRAHAVGLDRDGTWREYVAVPDEALRPVLADVDPAIAATFFTPTTTAAVALFEVGRLTAGETVMVTGATGAVGSMAVQLAHNAGARVIAAVSSASRFADLPSGVEAIALDDTVTTAQLDETRQVDLLIDTIGGVELARRLGWLRRGGRVACVGYTAGTQFTIDLPRWFFTSVAVLPVNLMANEPAAERYAEELLPQFAEGSLTLPVERFDITRVAEAVDKLRRGEIRGRAVLTF